MTVLPPSPHTHISPPNHQLLSEQYPNSPSTCQALRHCPGMPRTHVCSGTARLQDTAMLLWEIVHKASCTACASKGVTPAQHSSLTCFRLLLLLSRQLPRLEAVTLGQKLRCRLLSTGKPATDAMPLCDKPCSVDTSTTRDCRMVSKAETV